MLRVFSVDGVKYKTILSILSTVFCDPGVTLVWRFPGGPGVALVWRFPGGLVLALCGPGVALVLALCGPGVALVLALSWWPWCGPGAGLVWPWWQNATDHLSYPQVIHKNNASTHQPVDKLCISACLIGSADVVSTGKAL